MKKTNILITILFISSSLFAAFIPINDIKMDSYFESPARLIEIEESTPFGFSINTSSDIQALQFLSNPSTGLSDSAEYVKNFLLNSSEDYIYNNYEQIKSLFDFDPNFPSLREGANAEEAYYLINHYLNDNFDSLSAANKAWLAVNALESSLSIYPDDPYKTMGGDIKLALNLYGGKIKKGFGWDWQVNFDYTGSPSLVSEYYSIDNSDFIYANTMTVDLRANIGYASHMISEKFTVGLAIQPSTFFQTTSSNVSFLNARMEDDILAMFASNTFNVGLGIGLNIGAMYRINEELAFTFDIRNAPTFKSQYYFTADDFVSEKFEFHRDSNIYYVPTDIALTALWDRGPFHLTVELSDIVNQLIWQEEVNEYHFNFFSIPKIRFNYDINSNLMLTSKLQYEGLSVGIKWKELTTEISTKFMKGYLGIKFGYEF